MQIFSNDKFVDDDIEIIIQKSNEFVQIRREFVVEINEKSDKMIVLKNNKTFVFVQIQIVYEIDLFLIIMHTSNLINIDINTISNILNIFFNIEIILNGVSYDIIKRKRHCDGGVDGEKVSNCDIKKQLGSSILKLQKQCDFT